MKYRKDVIQIDIKYRQKGDKTTQTGEFYWSPTEKAWVEIIEGPDSIALYPEDGWEILGWKPSARLLRETRD